MDEALNSLFKSGVAERKMLISSSTGSIRVLDDNDQPGDTIIIKSLAELYTGTGTDNPDVSGRDLMGLLLAIEETFVTTYKRDPALTDGQVLAALERLCQSPEADMTREPLANEVQFSLRVALSLGDYNRQEVRQSLRKVKQSVARHNKNGGTRGYLNFIRQALSGK